MPDGPTDALVAAEPTTKAVVTDAADRQRYEAHVDEVLAGVLEYVARGERIILVHTEVGSAFEGRGVAASLTKFAIDDARRLGRRVIAECPYVKRYLAKHPDDLDIVVGKVQV